MGNITEKIVGNMNVPITNLGDISTTPWYQATEGELIYEYRDTIEQNCTMSYWLNGSRVDKNKNVSGRVICDAPRIKTTTVPPNISLYYTIFNPFIFIDIVNVFNTLSEDILFYFPIGNDMNFCLGYYVENGTLHFGTFSTNAKTVSGMLDAYKGSGNYKKYSICRYGGIDYDSTLVNQFDGNIDISFIQFNAGGVPTWGVHYFGYSKGKNNINTGFLSLPWNVDNFTESLFGEGMPEKIEFDDEFGDMSGSGGYGSGGGSFDDSSDAFGVPDLPSIGVCDTGFINVYNPSLNSLMGLAEDLFPDIDIPQFNDDGDLKAVADNVKAIGQCVKSFADCFINQNMIQYVIDCHIVPCVPSTTQNNGLKVGFKTFEYNPAKVTSDYVRIDCGYLSIKEYYKNFLDYKGTRAKLFLPFVGFVDLKNEWFQDGKIHVVYNYNVIDGSFMAFLLATSSKSKLNDTVVGSYGGNCCVHIPITGMNYSSMISGVVGGVSKGVSGLVHGDIGNVASGIEQTLSAKPDVEQSNSYNSNSSFMGVRIPYMIIERPVASFSKNYPHEKGLPLNATYKLSQVSGFTVCDSLDVENLSCTAEEKTMIVDLFKNGVIL